MSAKLSFGRSYPSSSNELLMEPKFRLALSCERQRSERSGNPLLLALVHFGRPKWSGQDSQWATAVFRSLCSVIRVTDTAGWYKQNESLGVIFTELGAPIECGPQNRINEKLKQVLCATVPAEAAKQMRITYHRFPEGDRGSSDPDDPFFYPQSALGTRRIATILKRSIDLFGSALALASLLPLLLLISVAIKLDSPGPVWLRQTRVGQGGRTFTLLKFRSMLHNCDASSHQDYVKRMIAGENVAQPNLAHAGIYKIVNDSRITRVGRILRRSSLDELPQLLNVIKGDMSLVGPRPALPYEFQSYSAWHRRRVLDVKPGITGLWQVKGRSRTTFDEMVRLDLHYARHWSLWLDLQILLKTPGAVVSGTGAY